VLSQNRYQVNNLQLGRAGEGYMLALGDIAPNFSSLSSSLGARGLYGQRQFADMTVYGFTGMVAESWETLDNRIPRSQYLKDVHGIKLEKAFGSSLACLCHRRRRFPNANRPPRPGAAAVHAARQVALDERRLPVPARPVQR
jgi:hypothetical protein